MNIVYLSAIHTYTCSMHNWVQVCVYAQASQVVGMKHREMENVEYIE